MTVRKQTLVYNKAVVHKLERKVELISKADMNSFDI